MYGPVTLFQKALRLTFRDRSDVRAGIGLFVLMVGAAAFEAIGIGIVMPFVSLLAHPELVEQYPVLTWIRDTSGVTTRTGLVTVFGLLLVGVFLLKNVYVTLVQLAQNAYTYGRQVRLENHLTETYLRRPWTFHLKHNSAELIHAVSHEVSQVYTHVVSVMFLMAVEGLSIVVIAGLLIAIEPLVVPGVAVVLGLVSFAFYRAVHRKAAQVGEQQRQIRTEQLKWLHQGLGGIKEARILGCEDYFTNAFTSRSHGYARALVVHKMLSLVPRYVLETTGILAIVLIAIAMFARGADEGRLLPVLGALAVASVRILPSLSHVIGGLSLIRFLKPSVEALWKALEPWPGDGKLGTRRRDVEPLRFERAITLRDVHLKYPGATRASLSGVSVEIRRGESVAFVGGSGAGKTTIVDAIIGLLEPTSGTIEIDGKPLEGDLVQRWQRAIGYIPQVVYLSDDTIRRNIAFGVEDEAIDEARIAAALEAAQLMEFVDSLPEKLDTFVGERGVRLSGGQRQRIGIARALYLQPQVLVLDEATSSLDGVTERDIVQSIERLRTDRTMIVIAHRLSTVRSCDRIFFMEHGKIRDVGTWEELYARDPAFRRLVELSRVDTDEPASAASDAPASTIATA